LVALLIFLNAVLIGIGADMELKAAFDQVEALHSQLFSHIDTAFTIVFTAELLLRIVALRREFCSHQDWQWNMFDVAIVMSSLIESVLSSTGLDLKYIRILRLARVVRTVRVATIVPVFGKLRAMINAVLSSWAYLVWAMGLLIFMMFMFGIIFIQGATQYVQGAAAGDDNVEFLETFFNSLGMTLLTLFMSLTSGINWWEVENVLLNIHPVYGVLFVLYISVMVLSLLNIMTGICVNNALDMVQVDRDLMLKLEMDRRMQHMEALQGVFADLDTKCSGKVTFEEFEHYLEVHEVQALFAVLGIEITEARAFFDALDVDGSMELEIDEFVMGCMSLQGSAKAVDMASMVRETKRVLRKIEVASKRTEARLKQIQNSMNVNDVQVTRFGEMGDNTESSITTSVRWDAEDMILLPKEAQASQPRRSRPHCRLPTASGEDLDEFECYEAEPSLPMSAACC